MLEPLWPDAAQPINTVALVGKELNRIADSYDADLDKIATALRAGGTFQDMRSLVLTHESHSAVVLILREIATPTINSELTVQLSEANQC